jgi:hypothetical protein
MVNRVTNQLADRPNAFTAPIFERAFSDLPTFGL